MKFLQDAALAALTSELTSAPLPGGGCGTQRRILNGRIEAYTTKRAGTDKRVAHELGERYRQEMENAEAAEEEYRENRERLRRMFGDGNSAGSPPGSPDIGGLRGGAYEFDAGLGGFSVGSGGGGIGGGGERRRSKSPKAVRIVSNEQRSGSSGSESSGSGKRHNGAGGKKSKPGGSRAGRRAHGRRRSKSVDIPSPVKRLVTENDEGELAATKASSVQKRAGRARSSSLDLTSSSKTKLSEKERRSQAKFEAKFGPLSRSHLAHRHAGYLCRSPLGDFHDPPARRLMTDLILTLNASFPDYDFGDYVRPMHFVKLDARNAVGQVNERLGEYAATAGASSGKGGAFSSGGGGPGRAGAPSSVGISSGSGHVNATAAGSLGARTTNSSNNSAFFGGNASSSSAAVDESKEEAGFLQRLWRAIDDAIDLSDCEVYSYRPPQAGSGYDGDDDPLGFLTQTLAGRDDSDPANMGNDGNNTAGSDEDIVPLWTFNYFFVSRSMKRILFFACVQTVSSEEEDMGDEEDEETTPYYPGSGKGIGADVVAPLPSLPETSFKVGGGGGLRSSSVASIASVASGYYSVSSSNAQSDVDFDLDGDGMAKDVPEPKPAMEADAPARRVVST